MAFFSVQRGLISLEGATLEDEVTLTTPVPVGKSFVIASARGSSYVAGYSMARVQLTTIVSDNYTKIKATRGATETGANCYVEWQVITGDGFTVQSGEDSITGTDTILLKDINAVTLSKAFIVLSSTYNLGDADIAFVRGRFTSTTQIELYRNIGGSPQVTPVCWYVVEWDGATVQSGLVTNDDEIDYATISEVDLSKTFLLYSYVTLTAAYVSRGFSRGRFSSTTQIEFKRGSGTGVNYISYFAITHNAISVQSGLKTIDGTSGTEVLDTAVDISKVFMPTPCVGNGYCPSLDIYSLHYGFNTQKLWQDGDDSKVTIERCVDNDILYASWFVVEAIIIPTTKTVSMDTLLRATDTEAISLDALLKGQADTSVNLDLLIKTLEKQDISLDALIIARNLESISVDALLKGLATKTISLDAYIRAINLIESVNLDMLIADVGMTKTVALDAILKYIGEQTIDLDAILKGISTTSISLDAIIGEALFASISLDTILFKALPPNRIYTIEIRNGDGDLLAILENAHGISYAQMINSPHSLTLDLPANDSKISNILLANECWLRDNRTDTIIRKFKLRHKMDSRS